MSYCLSQNEQCITFLSQCAKFYSFMEVDKLVLYSIPFQIVALNFFESVLKEMDGGYDINNSSI